MYKEVVFTGNESIPLRGGGGDRSVLIFMAEEHVLGHRRRWRRSRLGRSVCDLRQSYVYRSALIVQSRRLEDNTGRTDHHRQREDPQEQSIEHHRHILPVLLHLQTRAAM